MTRTSWPRVARGLTVVILAAAASLSVGGGTAQAYTCSGGKTITVTGDVSKATVTFYPECSDNRAHWSGRVWDTGCDKRAARVVLIANEAYGYWQWDHAYTSGNGCGSSATFSGSDNSVVDYAGRNWVVRVAVAACNTWNCSSYYNGYLRA
jgi:hypothetical protein